MFGWIVTGIWVILNMIIRAGIVRVEFHALVYCFSSLVLSFFLYFLGSVFLSFFSSVSLLIYFCPSLVFVPSFGSFVRSFSVCVPSSSSFPPSSTLQPKQGKQNHKTWWKNIAKQPYKYPKLALQPRPLG